MRRPDLDLNRLIPFLVGFGPPLAVLGIVAVLYAQAWHRLSAEGDGYRIEIAKLGWIAWNSDRLNRELAAALAARTSGNGSEDPGTDEAATAALQTGVKTMLDAASLQITSIQPISTSDEGDVRFVGVQAQVAGTYQKLVGFLQSVRTAAPAMIVSAMDLVPDTTAQASADVPAAGTPGSDANYVAQFEFVSPQLVRK